MNSENMKVLTNVIGAVESGGQIYGQRRYDAYTPPYTNTPNEHTITLGWAQNYGPEAKRLVQMIKDINPANFRNLDPQGSIDAMLAPSKDWVALRWNPTAGQRQILIKLIDSAAGHEAQDKLFAELMNKFIADCKTDYPHADIPAQMMYCEIRHLGGRAAADRIFRRCGANYDLDNIMKALNQDDPNSNQVGSKKFKSRHEKCIEFIRKYAVKESDMGYDIKKVLDVAESWVGYMEKKDGNLTYLRDKTANAGNANYTWFGYKMHSIAPSIMDYPAAWCDAFVDFCFYEAYGEAVAKKLLCGGFDDYTPGSAEKYKNKRQWYTNPKVGDQIFFKNSERICHTGIVYKVTAATVFTIEGNTSAGTSVIPNGGMVCKKSYPMNYERIAGYGRPDYGEQPQEVDYMYYRVDNIKLGSKNNSVLLFQEIAVSRGYKDQYGELLKRDGDCGARTVYVIDWYKIARKKQGKDLGEANGVCDQKMWQDLLALESRQLS